MRVLVRENRNHKDVLTVVQQYMTAKHPHTIIRSHSPYSLTTSGTEFYLTMGTFTRAFPICDLVRACSNTGIVCVISSVDAEATSYDVLDEAQIVWWNGSEFTDGNEPLEVCDRLVMIGTFGHLIGDVYTFECDSALVANDCQTCGIVSTIHGLWSHSLFGIPDTFLIGPHSVFFDTDTLTIPITNHEWVSQKLTITTNCRYSLDGSTLSITPVHKGFLNLKLPVSPMYQRSDPFEYRYVFYRT